MNNRETTRPALAGIMVAALVVLLSCSPTADSSAEWTGTWVRMGSADDLTVLAKIVDTLIVYQDSTAIVSGVFTFEGTDSPYQNKVAWSVEGDSLFVLKHAEFDTRWRQVADGNVLEKVSGPPAAMLEGWYRRAGDGLLQDEGE